MRPHLPPAIAAAVERAGGPSLIFERAVLAANMRRVAEAAHAYGIRALFAAKSFAHPEVLAMAAELLDGFDVASPGELAVVSRDKIVSIADPTGAAIAGARGARTIVVCETPAQAAAAPAHAEIAIRISASLLGRDPAIGAVLDGSGRRRSRFGVETTEHIEEIRRHAGARAVGLHLHHGPVTATSAERFIATAQAVLELAGFTPQFLDLGGAWHGLSIDDLPAAFAAVRAAIPARIELLVEPGRLYALGAGFACGRIRAARSLGDRELLTCDLSRAAHLRWSQPELVSYPPRPGEGRNVLIAGPTCYEEDVLGEWTVEPAQLAVGDRIVLRDVTGYAVGWNTGFGGVPPADAILV
jgi:diaminopimelate decarboxylase